MSFSHPILNYLSDSEWSGYVDDVTNIDIFLEFRWIGSGLLSDNEYYTLVIEKCMLIHYLYSKLIQ